MADPFQNVDAAGPEFIKMFADAMDARQSDPSMEAIVANYLHKLKPSSASHYIEIGAGAGAVSRRIAAHVSPATVTGFEPSEGFVQEARIRAADHPNLSFETVNGASLPLDDGSVDGAIMHTVLTHVKDPRLLITEAFRVLKPGGTLMVCDADFSKGTFACFPNDPLDVCAREFERAFVTDPYIVAKMKPLITTAGFDVKDFRLDSRHVSNNDNMIPGVKATTQSMVERGEIGQPLADALVGEYERRRDMGCLYGYQVMATAIAEKPSV